MDGAALGLGASTVSELLRRRAERQPADIGFTFSNAASGHVPDAVLTYAELDRQARRIAGAISSHGLVGDRVLLLYPPGLDYIAAFFGVLYAGRIAVPVFPPAEARTKNALARLSAVADDSGARLGLSPSADAMGLGSLRMEWFSTADLPEPSDAAGDGDPVPVQPETIAFLQYTSGSTGQPKGVMVSHGNLLENLALIAQACGYGAESRSVSWLPLYHDMGLIGCVLEPIFGGFPQHLISPLTFLRRPAAWLEAITAVKATTAAAPNFAYDLCAERVSESDLDCLDLSSWQTALNGAEPVKADTIERFVRRFSPVGFRASTMYPCYGLAEATLMVTGGAPAVPPLVGRFDPESLRTGRARQTPDGRPLVSCGQPRQSQEVAIVANGRPAPEHEIGEIWVTGPCVAQGYWQNAQETDATFGNRLPGDDRRWLKTGDLGFLAGGELYFAGRSKDILIVRGRNQAPQDVEATIESLDRAIKRGAVAVFDASSKQAGVDERICAVVGLERRADSYADHLAHQIRAAVASEHGIKLAEILFVRSRSIPKTSSGKIRRQQCRIMLAEDSFDVIARWPVSPKRPAVTGPAVTGPAVTASDVTAFLVSCVAGATGLPPEAIDVTTPYSELGLDSAAAIGIIGQVETFAGCVLPDTFFIKNPSIAAAAAVIAGEPATAAGTARLAAAKPSAKPAAERHRPGSGVAIVGMACRLPGAPSPADFWSLLRDGRCAVTTSPQDRTTLPATAGGFIADVTGFDCGFFRLSKRDATAIDPQQRLLLELAWEALEDAAIRPEDLAGRRVGVFVGLSSNDYAELFPGDSAVPWSALGQSHSIAANRISYFLGLRGPSMAIDTACSSSAVAAHLARHSLVSGECDLAFVGGANLILSPRITEFFTRTGALAPDGRCKAFDDRADGFVRSEGAGMLLVRRTADALESGNRIYSQIMGSAVNNDGATNGIMSPSKTAQQEVIDDACAEAGIDPRELAFVEAHGSGTSLGDAIEADALGAVAGRDRPGGGQCPVGSVKTNLGHLEAAAGIAGIMKASLSLYHRCLPPSLFFRESGPQVDLPALGLRVASRAEPLPADGPLTAGVSSFGFGGTNSHLVLAAPPAPIPGPVTGSSPGRRPADGEPLPEIVAVSAADESALRAAAARLRDRAWHATCAERPADFARTLADGRAALRTRAAFVAANWADVDAGLSAIADGTAGHFAGAVPRSGTPQVAFVYTGQGGQWPGMAASLIRDETVVAEVVECCDAEISDLAGWSPLDALRTPDSSAWACAERAQILGTITQLALTALWRSWGVVPAVVCGHSAGEVAAAYAAGAVDLSGAMELIAARSQLCERTAGLGLMVACEVDHREADAIVARYAGRVVVAAWNGPRSVVLSGEADAVTKIAAELDGVGRLARVLDVGFPGHGSEMRAIAPRICDALTRVNFSEPAIPFCSGTTGTLASHVDGPHWAANIAGPVRFDEALRAMLDQGVGACVEISPHPMLTPLVKQAADRPGFVAVGSIKRDSDDRTALLESAAALFASGCDVDLAATHRSAGRHLDLPTYPWQRTRCWFDAPAPAGRAGLAGVRASTPPRRWRVEWLASDQPADVELAALDRTWAIIGDPRRAAMLRAALAKWGVRAEVSSDWRLAAAQNCVYVPPVAPPDRLAGTDAAVAAEACCHELGEMVRRVPSAAQRLYLITTGGTAPAPREPTRVNAAHAALAGMWRSLGLEDRRVHRRLDVPPEAEFDADRVAQVLLATDQPFELALRDGQCFAPCLTPDTSAPATPVIHADATYLVTGGLGAIGTKIAGWLVDRGARHLALIGRRAVADLPADSAARDVVARARAAGVQVTTIACDLADPHAASAVLLPALASMPPVRGVVHAAGEVSPAPITEVTRADLARTLGAKVRGTTVLLGLGSDWQLDFLFAMTSIAGIWGSKLLSSYAAANAFVDGVMHELRASGVPASAIAWGPWAGTGMIAGDMTQSMAAIGVEPFDASAGLAALDAGFGPGTTVTVNADWPRFAELYRVAVPSTTLFDHVAPAAQARQITAPARSGDPWSAALDEIAAVLGEEPAALDLSRPLVALGFDSISALELKTRLEHRLGTMISSAGLLADAPVRDILGGIVAGLAGAASDQPSASDASDLVPFVAKPDDRYHPFPLNDIQLAYWVGRTSSFWLGEVSTHLYLEIENHAGLDLARLENAVNRLIQRHDMLRAVIDADGHQVVRRTVPAYQVARHDFRSLPDADALTAVLAVRERMSHQVIEPSRWPLFEFAASELPDGRTRLHVSLDGLVVDGASLLVLGRDLLRLYGQPGGELAPLTVTFRDVSRWQRESCRGAGYERSLAYWRDRVRTMPGSPALPLAKGPEQLAAPRFARREFVLDARQWATLSEYCQARALTPSIAICAAFARLMAAWSTSAHFTLNVTLFHRPPVHPEIGDVVGDFTSLLPFEVDARPPASFGEFARTLQDRLHEDLEYRDVSGVRVLRELARVRGGFAASAMPVVFTSLIQHGDIDLDWLGEVVYSITQTPQVYLDHQVSLRHGQLVVTWDTVDELFHPGLVDEMFAAYHAALAALAEPGGAAWQSPGGELYPVVLPVPATRPAGRPVTGSALLHDAFETWACAHPDDLAIVAPGQRLTYGQVLATARAIAARLIDQKVAPGDFVPVLMPKGWEQAAAALATSMAGLAYAPVDPEWPAARIQSVLRRTGATVALVTAEDAADYGLATIEVRLDMDAGHQALGVRARPTDLAYVIFTSGTTGEPKGVMIEHAAALNTIVAINELFDVGPGDKVLGLSNMSFDLSVWDIFGTLGTGATLVVPPAAAIADPAQTAGIVATEGVTIWNSVPSLADMHAVYTESLPAGDASPSGPSTLRLFLLSGDWIPLSLPERLTRIAPASQVISLGGATEASIWSVYYPIDAVDPQWRSIPYGTALPGQDIVVRSDSLRPCPAWVEGEIYIGGAGVARGYLGDPELTGSKFTTDPESGERLYRTGDRGRLLPDGNVEILGRTDHQVKIGGYRIELGELEHHLRLQPGVEHAIAVTCKLASGAIRLIAYVTPADIQRRPLPEDLERGLRSALPDYMIPAEIGVLDRLPVTANGKIDRAKLSAPTRGGAADPQPVPDDLSDAVKLAWTDVLRLDRFDPAESFLAAGGDSLVGTRLVGRLRETLDVVVPIQALFDAQDFTDFCQRVRTSLAGADETGALPTASYPATHMQRRLFVLQEAQPRSPAYNMAVGVAIRGPLDIRALRLALDKVTERHGPLRCRFERSDDGVVAEELPDIGSVLKVAAPFDACDAAKALALLESDARKPFDLGKDPLVRALVVSAGADEHWLGLCLHHCVADGWSLGVILAELGTYYVDPQTALPPPRQFAAFARLEDSAEARQARAASLDYWRAKLRGCCPTLSLPADRVQADPDVIPAGYARIALPGGVQERIAKAAVEAKATLFHLVTAAFGVVVGRLADTTDLIVGTAVAGRDDPGSQGMVGCFVNTVPLRIRLDAAPTAGDLVRQVRGTTIEAEAHADVPFDELVKNLDVPRPPGRTPLVQVMVAMQNTPLPAMRLGPLELSAVPVTTAAAQFDLQLRLVGLDDQLTLTIEYAADRFSDHFGQAVLDALLQVLEQISDDQASPVATVRLAPPRPADDDAPAGGPDGPASLLTDIGPGTEPENIAVSGGSLAASARSAVFGDEVTSDPARLVRELDAAGITVWSTTPSQLGQCLDELARGASFPRSLRQVICSGEPLSAEIARRWFDATDAALTNAYGATAGQLTNTLRGPRELTGLRVPAGRPVNGVRAAVVDSSGHQVPDGFPGQLAVSRPGGPAGLTGDVARVLPDGAIDVLGRGSGESAAHRVQVELSDIEAAIIGHPAVAAVAVTEHDGPGGTSVLAAHVVWRAGRSTDFVELSRYAAAKLPRQAVPARWQVRAAMPLTRARTTDKTALGLPDDAAQTSLPGSGSALRGWIEAQWIACGAEAGQWHDFFAAGGDSFGAAGLVATISEHLGAELSLGRFLADPSVAWLEEAAATVGIAAGREPDKGTTQASAVLDGRLSPAQEQIWLRQKLDLDDPAFNIPVGLHLAGQVDCEALAAAFGDVCARHDLLAGALAEDGDGVPRWKPRADAGNSPLLVTDLSGEPAPWDAALAFARRLAATPVSLSDATYSAALLRCAPDSHLLVMVIHHIAADGASLGVLLADLAEKYSDRVGAPAGEGAPGPAPAPAGGWAADPGSAILRETTLDSDLVASMRQRHRATAYMLITAVWAAVVHRLTGSGSVRLAVPVGLPGDPVARHSVGMHVDMRVLELTVDRAATFRDLVASVRRGLLATYAADRGSTADYRDIDAMVVSQPPMPPVRMPGLEIRHVRLHTGAAKYPATLFIDSQASGTDILFEFARTADWADLADQAPRAMVALLRAAAKDPDIDVGAMDLAGEAAAGPVESIAQALAMPLGKVAADD